MTLATLTDSAASLPRGDSRRPRYPYRSHAKALTVPPCGLTPRQAWTAWVSPWFTGNDSAYFTGTYSDGYGYPHGLMLVRNVHRDFRAFLRANRLSGRRWIAGVEAHRFRDILHVHAIIEGPFTEDERRYVKAAWEADRGYARVLPVLDGCASYVTKYALKGEAEAFEWNL